MSAYETEHSANAERPAIGLCHFHPALLQLRHEGVQVFGIALGHQEIATRDGACHQESAGLNAVGDDGVLRSAQAFDALHADG